MARSLSEVPLEEAAFHPHSFFDPAGRLFSWNGELYRALSYESRDFYAGLLEREPIRRLMARGLLVQTEIAPLTVRGYAAVLRHRRVPVVSYPNEWPLPMLRDAALMILELVGELQRCGLTLKDAHPWNVLFDGCQPVWVDWTSIALRDSEKWPAEDEFRRFTLNPLLLMASGHDRLARLLLPEDSGVTHEDVCRMTPRRDFFSRARVSRFSREPLARLQRALEDVASPPPLDPRLTGSGGRGEALAPLLEELQPTSVLEIEGGWLADLVTAKGPLTLSMSADHARAAALYAHARAAHIAVLPLVVSYADPTPQRGIGDHWQIGAAERLRCELAVALGISDRALADHRIRFDQVVAGLSAFTTRWLLVDFVPGGHPTTFGGHTSHEVDPFLDALHAQFANVRLVDAESGRSLALCER